MRKVLLDANFILNCIEKKIDLFEYFQYHGLKIIIPTQVIRELKEIKNPNTSLTLKILEKNSKSFEKIDIGKGHVDDKIKEYSENQENIFVATEDKELKKRLNVPKFSIRGKSQIERV